MNATYIRGTLFAVSAILVAGAVTSADTTSVVHAGGPASHQLTPLTGYSPAIIETAYGITPLLTRGIDGAGETVAIPELFAPGPLSPTGNATDIRQDLVRFDSRLPASSFQLPASRCHAPRRHHRHRILRAVQREL